MAFGDRFKDEPAHGSTNTQADEVKTYSPPTDAGFYWVKIPEHIRPTKDGKTPMKARGHWNGIAQIYGVSPFLKMKLWDIPSHGTSFGNAPHLIEYGPKINLPEGAEF